MYLFLPPLFPIFLFRYVLSPQFQFLWLQITIGVLLHAHREDILLASSKEPSSALSWTVGDIDKNMGY